MKIIVSCYFDDIKFFKLLTIGICSLVQFVGFFFSFPHLLKKICCTVPVCTRVVHSTVVALLKRVKGY